MSGLKSINVLSILLELVGTIILAIGATAFFLNNEIANSSILRIPRSSTEGPPSENDYLNSSSGKEKLNARRHARIGTVLIISGLLLELIVSLES